MFRRKTGKKPLRGMMGNELQPMHALPDDVCSSANNRVQKFLESARNYVARLPSEGSLSVDGRKECISSSQDIEQSSSEPSLLNPYHRRQLHPVVLSIDQIEEYERAFQKYDINGDGVISVSELSILLGTLGLRPTEDEVVEMIAAVDANHDGVLSCSEFIRLMSRQHNPGLTPATQFEAIFKVFDTDGNGFISRSEFKDTLFSIGQKCTEEELNTLIDEIDLDRDGFISQREFLSAFIEYPSSPNISRG